MLSYQVNNPPFFTVLTHIAIYDREINSIVQVEDEPGKNICRAAPSSTYAKLSTEVWCQSSDL